MDETIKAEWVAALRSGNYYQVHGQLAVRQGNSHSFCCLGVLCDILHRKGMIDRVERVEHQEVSIYYDAGHGKEGSILPNGVPELVGLSTTSPAAKVNGRKELLIDLNDRDGWSFSQIADIIEASDI